MEDTSFNQLWQAYQAGDAQAKNRLLADFIPRIAGLVRKYLRNPIHGENVEQSVLLSFLANHEARLGAIARADDLWQLFAAITLRHCSKHNKRNFRARRRGPVVSIEGGHAADRVPAGYTPVDAGMAPDMKAAFADLFAECGKELTERQQRILAEHLAGADRKDIAQALTVSIPTVDRELSKIKSFLKVLATEKDE